MEQKLETGEGAPHQQYVDAEGKPLEQQQGGEQRPGWLPDNFKSPEDLAKSYSEAQAELTRLKQEQAKGGEETPTEDKKAEEAPPSDEKQQEIKKGLESQGLDVDSMSERFWETGEVAVDDRAEIKKAAPWVTDEIINQFAEGQKALMEARTSDILSEVGGQEGFQELSVWAVENLEPNRIEALNRTLASGDVDQAKLALSMLKAQRDGNVGSDPSRQLNGRRGGGRGDVYQSAAQMQADMSDPRYKTDPAFRAAVQDKLMRSQIL